MISPLILAGAAGAIAALVALNWVLFRPAPQQIPDLEAARARLNADAFAIDWGEGLLSTDGRSAVFLDRAGRRFGVVVAQGANLVSRDGDRRAIRHVGAGADGALTLDLGDFTLPPITVRCADAEAAAAWAHRLSALHDPAA